MAGIKFIHGFLQAGFARRAGVRVARRFAWRIMLVSVGTQTAVVPFLAARIVSAAAFSIKPIPASAGGDARAGQSRTRPSHGHAFASPAMTIRPGRLRLIMRRLAGGAHPAPLQSTSGVPALAVYHQLVGSSINSSRWPRASSVCAWYGTTSKRLCYYRPGSPAAFYPANRLFLFLPPSARL